VDPITVIPVSQAKFFDGDNVEEIVTWLQTEVTGTFPGATQVWWQPGGEQIWLSHGNWILASMGNPPLVVDQMPDEAFRTRYAVHPGPVTAPPPLGGEPVTP